MCMLAVFKKKMQEKIFYQENRHFQGNNLYLTKIIIRIDINKAKSII